MDANSSRARPLLKELLANDAKRYSVFSQIFYQSRVGDEARGHHVLDWHAARRAIQGILQSFGFQDVDQLEFSAEFEIEAGVDGVMNQNEFCALATTFLFRAAEDMDIVERHGVELPVANEQAYSIRSLLAKQKREFLVDPHPGSIFPQKQWIFPAEYFEKEFLIEPTATHIRSALGSIFECVHIATGTRRSALFVPKSRIIRPLREVRFILDRVMRLDHPSIAQIYGAYEDKKQLIIISELFNGADIAGACVNLFRTEEELSIRNYARNIISAVAHMHDNKIRHGLIGPPSIRLAGKQARKMTEADQKNGEASGTRVTGPIITPAAGGENQQQTTAVSKRDNVNVADDEVEEAIDLPPSDPSNASSVVQQRAKQALIDSLTLGMTKLYFAGLRLFIAPLRTPGVLVSSELLVPPYHDEYAGVVTKAHDVWCTGAWIACVAYSVSKDRVPTSEGYDEFNPFGKGGATLSPIDLRMRIDEVIANPTVSRLASASIRALLHPSSRLRPSAHSCRKLPWIVGPPSSVIRKPILLSKTGIQMFVKLESFMMESRLKRSVMVAIARQFAPPGTMFTARSLFALFDMEGEGVLTPEALYRCGIAQNKHSEDCEMTSRLLATLGRCQPLMCSRVPVPRSVPHGVFFSDFLGAYVFVRKELRESTVKAFYKSLTERAKAENFKITPENFEDTILRACGVDKQLGDFPLFPPESKPNELNLLRAMAPPPDIESKPKPPPAWQTGTQTIASRRANVVAAAQGDVINRANVEKQAKLLNDIFQA